MAYSNFAASSNLTKKKDEHDKLVSAGADQTNKLASQSTLGKIQNYGEFNYDNNGDALYQQYKDQYTRQGNLAMQDTIGKASAMTGGYGNSYAQQVGQQTFNGYMQALNDKIPELYALAYDKHNQGLNNLYNQYNLENNAYLQDYGEYMDKVNLSRSDLEALYGHEFSEHTNRQNYDAQITAANIEAAATQEKAALEMQKWALENGYAYDATTGGFVKTAAAQGEDYVTSLAPYITGLEGISTKAGRKDYINSNSLASETGLLTEDEVDWLAENYVDAYIEDEANVSLRDRTWKQEGTYGTGWNWWGNDSINRDAMVRDQFDNVYTLGNLYKELEETVGAKTAKAYVLKLQSDLGVGGNWIW